MATKKYKMLYYNEGVLVRIVDGDTFDLIVDVGFDTLRRITVRLDDIDAPEVRGAEKAKGKALVAHLEKWFDNEKEIVVQTTHRDDSTTRKELGLKTTKGKRGKYGRWLGKVFVNGVSVTSEVNKFMRLK